MRLADLDPTLLRYETPGRWRQLDAATAPETADGLLLLCPTCWAAHGTDIGTHSILCWSPTVPSDQAPGPGRWTLHGADLDHLTLRGAGGSDSIHTPSGCGAHCYIRDGAVARCP